MGAAVVHRHGGLLTVTGSLPTRQRQTEGGLKLELPPHLTLVLRVGAKSLWTPRTSQRQHFGQW